MYGLLSQSIKTEKLLQTFKGCEQELTRICERVGVRVARSTLTSAVRERGESKQMATATVAEAPLLRPSSEEWADPITYLKRVQPIVEQ